MSATRFTSTFVTRLVASLLIALVLTLAAIGSAADQGFNVVFVAPGAGDVLTEPVRWEVTVGGLYPDRVEFLVDGNLQWTERYAPYVFNGDNGSLDPVSLGPGSHTLRAVAYHADQSTATELTVSFPGPSESGGDGAGAAPTTDSSTQAPTGTSGLDLAAGKQAAASSVESSALGAELAVDGVHSSRWSSAWKDGQWWQVDLGEQTIVDTIVVNWEAAYARSYKVQVSSDGTSFVDAASESIDAPGVRRTSFAPVNARYVRVLGIQRATGYGISAWDIEVYGPQAPASPSPPPGDQTPAIPPSGSPASGGSSDQNLAAGKQTWASSLESDALASRYAVDGSRSTRWGSAYADDQWWKVDLGSPTTVDRVVIDWEVAYGAKYIVQVSSDGSSFQNVAQESAKSSGPKETTFSSTSARYVRVMGVRRATPYGFSAWEIEVYGPGPATAPPAIAAAPTVVALPAITGSLAPSSTLTTSAGNWTGSPTSFAYAWQRCDESGATPCVTIPGETSQSYQVTLADVGASLRSKVTATNAIGSTTATSAQSGVIQPSTALPTAATPPVVTGSATQGSTLTTTAGAWTGSPTTFAYAWLRCDAAGNSCAPITGATAQSYRLVTADVGTTLRSRITASSPAGSGTATSARTGVVAPAPTSVGNVGSSLPSRLGPSTGQHFYVNGESGSDSNPGTLSAPWRSIGHAWSNAPAGSVINVRAGTYGAQTVLMGRSASSANPITVRAYPGESVTLTNSAGTGAAVYVENVTGLRIEGFRVTNPSGDGIKVSTSSDVELVGNSVFGCGNQGILVGGSGSSGQTYSRNVQIWSNRIYANGRGGSAKYHHGIYYGNTSTDDGAMQRGAVNGVIANNVFYDQPTGFHLQIGPEANGLIVTNNTFTAASSADSTAGSAIVIWGSGHQYSTKNVLVVNNALAFNQNHGARGSGTSSGSTVRNNLGYANPGGDFVPDYTGGTVFSVGPGNITGADPRFVDRGAHNYNPDDNSPLIDHADPTYAPPTDNNGHTRIGPPDIGAFERQG